MKRARAGKDDLLPAATPVAETASRRFASLGALYEAMGHEDVPPSPGFSGHVVPGEGPGHAALMLVGEQPGDQEDIEGRPFVGPAGRMLDACLAEAGLDRGRAFLTNAVKRFKFTPRGKRRLHSTPTAGDIAHYRWWLAEEVRLVDPVVVVTLGATALHALSGKRQALGALRGAVLPWEGRHMVVTVHPSFLLRLRDEADRAAERARFVHDLAVAVDAAAAGRPPSGMDNAR